MQKPKTVKLDLDWTKAAAAALKHTELCHGAFSPLPHSPCRNNHMGLNPISHCVVTSFWLYLLCVHRPRKVLIKHMSILNFQNTVQQKCEQVLCFQLSCSQVRKINRYRRHWTSAGLFKQNKKVVNGAHKGRSDAHSPKSNEHPESEWKYEQPRWDLTYKQVLSE